MHVEEYICIFAWDNNSNLCSASFFYSLVYMYQHVWHDCLPSIVNDIYCEWFDSCGVNTPNIPLEYISRGQDTLREIIQRVDHFIRSDYTNNNPIYIDGRPDTSQVRSQHLKPSFITFIKKTDIRQWNFYPFSISDIRLFVYINYSTSICTRHCHSQPCRSC